MNTTNTPLSSRRLSYIRAQGYFHLSDEELTSLAFGNRFAYILCGTTLAVGVTMAHIPTLIGMASIAFASVILPNHGFDYLYNHFIRHMLNKPKLPPRSKQLKFACTIATLWIAAVIYLFHTGQIFAGYVMGGLLLTVVSIVITTDFCIPSYIYNHISPTNRVRIKEQY